ncbi:MAG: hypothetical protein QHH19_02595 [Candidatus Thermoplasmatota archaeon]|nr:hypothetical protein [Candidatus Thermoplasmatota archaeon]
MRKTISLRLTPDEENIVKQLVRNGISQSKIFREALLRYFDSVNQPVNHFQQEENDEAVNHVNQIVNHPGYVNLYIDQLNSRIQQLENEANEWKNKYYNEIKDLKESYKTLQNEYFNQTKDSIKRLDDKFDRLMFYLEEYRKPVLQTMDLSGTKKEDTPDHNTIKISKRKKTEKPKKGWVFRMYRM